MSAANLVYFIFSILVIAFSGRQIGLFVVKGECSLPGPLVGPGRNRRAPLVFWMLFVVFSVREIFRCHS